VWGIGVCGLYAYAGYMRENTVHDKQYRNSLTKYEYRTLYSTLKSTVVKLLTVPYKLSYYQYYYHYKWKVIKLWDC